MHVPFTDENDGIIVDNLQFSRRHFARNYAQQFERATIEHYRQYGVAEVRANVTTSGITLYLGRA